MGMLETFNLRYIDSNYASLVAGVVYLRSTFSLRVGLALGLAIHL